MVSKAAPAPKVETFAEGSPVPTVIPPASPEAVAAMTRPPTVQDIRREWGTYVAVAPLKVGVHNAVPVGGSVPISHPALRDTEDGPGWVSEGLVKLRDGAEPPADLVDAHKTFEASQATYPGAHPGV